MSRNHRRMDRTHARAPAVTACKICGTVAPSCGSVDFNKNCESRRGLVLSNFGTQIQYQRCPKCGFVFTSAFDAWQPGDYKREIYNDDYRLVDPDYETLRPIGCAAQISDLFAANKASLNVLDYGGGNGLMSRELVRSGFASACTYDPFAEAYAVLPTTQFNLVTCFETLEHVPDPLTTIGQICSLVKPGGMVVFSTLLQPEVFDLNWWYLAPRNGHISLFTQVALSSAWAKHGFQIKSWNSNLHAAFREVPDFAPVAIRNSKGLLVAMPAAPTLGAVDFGFNNLTACRSGTMLYNKNDQYVGASLRKYGECSIGETILFGLIVQPGTTVLEIGANIGMHTVDLSRLVGPTGRVHAFEPQRLVFQVLCANLALNSCPNVFTYQAAVGAHSGTVSVPWLDPDTNTNFGGLSLLGTVQGDKVPLLTIDALELGACHLIKVDVEGMETEALRGAAATISRFRPMLYVENDRAERSAELISLLQSYGYRLYWHLPPLFNAQNFRGDPENIFGSIVFVNMLCIPAEIPQDMKMLREVTGPADTWH